MKYKQLVKGEEEAHRVAGDGTTFKPIVNFISGRINCVLCSMM